MKDHQELLVCLSCGRRNWNEHKRCAWCGGKITSYAGKFMLIVMGIVSVVAGIATTAMIWSYL